MFDGQVVNLTGLSTGHPGVKARTFASHRDFFARSRFDPDHDQYFFFPPKNKTFLRTPLNEYSQQELDLQCHVSH